MEIDNKDKEAPKDVVFSTSNVHPLDGQKDLVELSKPMEMSRVVVMIK